MEEEKVNRINELYHKAKAEGLTQQEQREQELLRKEYIAAIRNNLKGQLDNISIQNPDGSVTRLSDKAKERKGC